MPKPALQPFALSLDYLTKLRTHPRALLVLEKSRKLESREA